MFAIVKDTARRFTENETVVVTANDFDRDLAARFDFVEIDGDKAVYHNHWMAGGNEITWNMIHYDVQLIGGVVLHQGKIAEMATGEGKTLVAKLRQLTGKTISKEEGRKGTIAYSILKNHNTSGVTGIVFFATNFIVYCAPILTSALFSWILFAITKRQIKLKDDIS